MPTATKTTTKKATKKATKRATTTKARATRRAKGKTARPAQVSPPKKGKTKAKGKASILANAPKGTPVVVYSKDRKGEFRWTLYAKNRTIIAASSEGFKRKGSAESNFTSTIRNGEIAEPLDATRS